MDDAAGFTAFVTARGPALLRLGWLLTGDADAAEDLAQEALARLVRHWDRVSRDGNPEAYVRTSMRSIWIDSWRRRHGWSVSPTDAVPDAGASDPAIDAVPSRQAVVTALARLAPRQRAVLVLRFYEDLTEVATAKALGCSASTVKSQTREALANLRRLAPWLADELDGAAAEPPDDLSAGPPGRGPRRLRPTTGPAVSPAVSPAQEVTR
nr:SigE family RNA polymerase sigma factor [Kineosporia sp. A_224]